MAIPQLLNTGHTGLIAAKAGIATTGHNITNANVEGYSRQRMVTVTADPLSGQWGGHTLGAGTKVSRIDRINDEYIEKQLRAGQRDLSYAEEKEMALSQVEDVLNELDGDGLNRLVSGFFNEFRKLANEPENPAFRQSVREATLAVANDFRRLRQEIADIQKHIDHRIEGYAVEMNSISKEIADLNLQISTQSMHGVPNDLLDRRDLAIKKLASFVDLTTYSDQKGHISIELKGIGPWVMNTSAERISVQRSPASTEGKVSGALDILSTGSAMGVVTRQIRGGKLGALLDVRDQTVSAVLDRLDQMAYTLTETVNAIHRQGVTPDGMSGVHYFKPLEQVEGAAEKISLSNEVSRSIYQIATALTPNSPGDNRVALAIADLQNEKILHDGKATFDESYDGMVSDVGVSTAQNKFVLNQQKDRMAQLGKIREQISGVSIDEETTQLLQYQHAFDASAKVIQVADELLKTILSLK